jgi:hypothetical protein
VCWCCVRTSKNQELWKQYFFAGRVATSHEGVADVHQVKKRQLTQAVWNGPIHAGIMKVQYLEALDMPATTQREVPKQDLLQSKGTGCNDVPACN